MEFIRGLHNIRPEHRGCVATIGNFDGVHLGHRAVVDQLQAHARALGQPSLVTIFEPQPREYFAGPGAPGRLTRLREKCTLLAALGIERILCVRFDAALAALSAEAFVDVLLVRGLGVRLLVVGDDFRFGRNRSGDVAVLRAMGERQGFQVVRAASHCVHGRRVSSTWVREALAAGDFDTARGLLGRPYCLGGRVIHGDKRGRSIGYPTANVALHRRAVPLSGIFAVRVRGLGPRAIPAVAYVGTRPIVNGSRPLLEVHMFGYSGECYGRRIKAEFVAKIRDDMPFESFAALRRQIDRDADRARVVLGAGGG